jgi:hypothetical protein
MKFHVGTAISAIALAVAVTASPAAAASSTSAVDSVLPPSAEPAQWGGFGWPFTGGYGVGPYLGGITPGPMGFTDPTVAAWAAVGNAAASGSGQVWGGWATPWVNLTGSQAWGTGGLPLPITNMQPFGLNLNGGIAGSAMPMMGGMSMSGCNCSMPGGMTMPGGMSMPGGMGMPGMMPGGMPGMMPGGVPTPGDMPSPGSMPAPSSMPMPGGMPGLGGLPGVGTPNVTTTVTSSGY